MSHRIERVQATIAEEISLIVLNELKDPRVERVTILDVKISHDLRNATVYFSVLSDEREDIEQAQLGLEHARGYIRRQLGEKVRLRYIPELIFRFDDSITRAARITELLEQIKHDEEP
ncbi:MAG: 30S ribosome-binding factor RbfA [bacterium]|nr:30S ribosome-binding factor RbfA [bacterium]